MNIFGNLFKVNILGASHGPAVAVVIEGVPAGLPINEADFLPDLKRRQGGNEKGTTPRKESDLPIIKSGVFQNKSTGTPILIEFLNENTRSGDYDKTRDFPRPSHADWVAHQKYGGFEDYRGGGAFSARLTVGIVAAGVIAKKLMPQVTIQANVTEIGGLKDLELGLQRAIEAKDSVGGIVECIVNGLPVGLGEPFWDSVESLLAHAAFAIPAVRGVEFGTGFAAAKMFGLQHNDAILKMNGTTQSNHAGGVVGGITNGNELIYRIAIKPTASTPQMQHTLNWTTEQVEDFSIKGRHDLCVALRAPVILEAMTAIVLADLMKINQQIPTIWNLHE